MYVWFLIFWIIYNTPPLFLTMQLSLIIKNSWFPWKELQLYCKNFFIYSDCFSSFDRLLLTFESNLFVEAFFFLLFFLLWLLFQLQNFLKKLTFESNLFNATLFLDGVFSAGSLPLMAVVASGRHAQSPKHPSLTFFCHSSLYYIWLPSEMSTLSPSYLPNLKVLLLLPSFATLVSTIFHPQKWTTLSYS